MKHDMYFVSRLFLMTVLSYMEKCFMYGSAKDAPNSNEGTEGDRILEDKVRKYWFAFQMRNYGFSALHMPGIPSYSKTAEENNETYAGINTNVNTNIVCE